MRFLHVISSTDPATGGPVEAIVQVGSVLCSSGHQIEIVSVDSPDSPWLHSFPYKVHALGPGNTQYSYTSKLVPWLRSHACEYDAVIVHGLWQFTTLATWLALRRQRQPYFVYSHGMLDPWFKHAYPLKHLKKSIFWLIAEYRVLRDAHAVLFTCEEEVLLAAESFSPYRVTAKIAPYTTAGPQRDIAALRQEFLETYPSLSDKRLVLFLSRIHPKKGCDLAIQAFTRTMKHDSRLHLVMAGPDQLGWQRDLETLALKLGAQDRITWTGPLYGDSKWSAFAAAEVFFLPSHQENFGIVVAEALSTGTPVLISNQINIWREIAKAHAGLVDADTLESAVNMLQRWLDMSDEDRGSFSVAAYNCYKNSFSAVHAAEALLSAVSPTTDR